MFGQNICLTRKLFGMKNIYQTLIDNFYSRIKKMTINGLKNCVVCIGNFEILMLIKY